MEEKNMYPKPRKARGETGIKIEDFSSREEYHKAYNKAYREKYSQYWKEYHSQHKSESKRNEVVRKILDAFDFFKYKDQIEEQKALLKEIENANKQLLKEIKKSVEERLSKKRQQT